jgi:hypothetical protein
MLRKAHPDLAVKVHCTQEKESCPRKKEWRPKPTKADGTAFEGPEKATRGGVNESQSKFLEGT